MPAAFYKGEMLAKTVYIQTYCEHPALAYGALMVFQTIRIGFPTAQIVVVDNGSHKDVLPRIHSECVRVGAKFLPVDRRNFLDFFRDILSTNEQDIAICDPDVVFWESVEDWKFDAVIAGRKIPDLVRYGVRSLARIHPSLVFIHDVAKLRTEIQRRHVNKSEPLGQFASYIGGQKLFWDTLAPIYQMMPELCHEFTPEELDAYDHLFYGSHLPVIAPGLKDNFTSMAHYLAASGDLNSLKGLWRLQEVEFAKPDHGAQVPQDAFKQMVHSCRGVGELQGVKDGYSDAVIGLIKGATC